MEVDRSIAALPEVVRVAIELGLVALVLVFTAQFARLRMVQLVLVALAFADAFRLKVIDLHWAGESLLVDAPWGIAGLVLLSQVAGIGWLRFAPARLRWVALAWLAPATVAHPAIRERWAGWLGAPGRRLAMAWTAIALASCLPWVFPGGLVAGGIGRVGSRGLGAGLLALGGLALFLTRRREVAPAGSDAGPVPLAPLLSNAVAHALLAGLVGWLFVLSSAADLVGLGIEGVESWLPGTPWAGLALIGIVAGTVGDRLLVAMCAQLVFARAMSVQGQMASEAIVGGLTAGGLLPLAWALGAGKMRTAAASGVLLACVVAWFLFR
jgi:hypothetical protein